MKQHFQHLKQFFEDFIAGLSRRDVERMFDEDATRALTVLTGGDEVDPQRPKDLTFYADQVRKFFLGLAFKLSPARRLLFTLSWLTPLFGLVMFDSSFGPTQVIIDFSPFWFGLGFLGLTLLLALELVDQLEVRDELQVARQLQRELLPHSSPNWPGYHVSHSYRTANAIGGDYYDFLPIEDGRFVLTVGDASGHGIAAGLLMAISNASLKTAIDLNPEPLAVLRLLNRSLYSSGGSRAFMSLFYSLLDPSTGTLDYACAGHPFPLLRRTDGEILELGHGALPLGLRQTAEFEREQIQLEPGDTLVLYSDGLVEAVGGPREEAFGFERLRALLKLGGDSQAVHDRIIAGVQGHLGERSLADDLTLVVIRYVGQLPPPPTDGETSSSTNEPSPREIETRAETVP